MIATDQSVPSFSFAFLRKWFVIVFIIKLALFAYFAVMFKVYFPAEKIHADIAIFMGDTDTYYKPAEDFVQTGEYGTPCRMPGAVPLYAPFSFLCGQECAYFFVVVLQFLFSVISVLLLAIVASRLFNQRFVFEGTAIVYALSSFVSIWDHTLMSDSFSTSFIVFSVYCFYGFVSKGKTKYLMLAGVWLAWAIFLRQIAVVLIPVFCIILLFNVKNSIKEYVLRCSLFVLPVALSIGIWTYRNFKTEHQFIPLVKPVSECYATYTKPFMAVSQLLITWGDDIQFWLPDTKANWFNANQKQEKIFSSHQRSLETPECNADSIVRLQNMYVVYRTTEDSALKAQSESYVLAATAKYISAYKTHHAFRFYVLNRLMLWKTFVFPSHLDNLPGPAFQDMNIIQKAIKFGYFAMLLAVNFFGMMCVFMLLIKRRWKQLSFAFIPMSLMVVLAVILGFVEQRYLVPVYPFMVVLSVAFFTQVIARKRRIVS